MEKNLTFLERILGENYDAFDFMIFLFTITAYIAFVFALILGFLYILNKYF